MDSNRTRKLRRNDRAEVGIGTLIVFIAMVLVASVAAAVLVNTSGVLQSRALATGKASSDQVASNVHLVEVMGNRTAGAGNIRGLTLYVQLAPGGLAVNLDNLWIHFTDAAGSHEIIKGASASDATYTVSFVREVGSSNSVLENGEVAKIAWIVNLEQNERGRVSVNPEAGQQTYFDFYAPNSFGSATDIPLF